MDIAAVEVLHISPAAAAGLDIAAAAEAPLATVAVAVAASGSSSLVAEVATNSTEGPLRAEHSRAYSRHTRWDREGQIQGAGAHTAAVLAAVAASVVADMAKAAGSAGTLVLLTVEPAFADRKMHVLAGSCH